MAKLTTTDITNLQNETTVVTAINANNALIETAMENTLSRDGTTPNTMDADIDLNSNKVINLAEPTNNADAVTKYFGDNNYGGASATAAAASAAAALVSENNASTSETNTAADAVSTAADVVSSGTNATDASNSATAAAASAAEGLYRDVVVVNFAASPYTIVSAQDGDFFKVDTSGGAVTINLPDLSLESGDFRCAIMKETVDANSVTVSRQGTDTINGSTSSTLTSQYEATNFIGDQSTLEWSGTDATTGSSLLIANNLSDLSNAATARTNLGTAIGSDVQAYDAALDVVTGTNTGDEVSASTDVEGVVEKSTSAENVTGTSDIVYPTVAGTKEMIDTHGGGTKLITRYTPSAASSVDITGFDETLYDGYEIRINNLKPVDDGVSLYIRTSTDGGSTFDSGAGNYGYTFKSTNSTGSDANSVSTGTTQLGINSTTIGNATGEYISGVVQLFRPDEAVNTMVDFRGGHFDTGGSFHHLRGVGFRLSNADVDALTLFFSTGNIASGTVDFIGILKA